MAAPNGKRSPDATLRQDHQARAAHAFLQSQLRLVEREWTAFKSGQLAPLNAVLQSRKLPVVLGVQP